jgi:hypothetical protein
MPAPLQSTPRANYKDDVQEFLCWYLGNLTATIQEINKSESVSCEDQRAYFKPLINDVTLRMRARAADKTRHVQRPMADALKMPCDGRDNRRGDGTVQNTEEAEKLGPSGAAE